MSTATKRVAAIAPLVLVLLLFWTHPAAPSAQERSAPGEPQAVARALAGSYKAAFSRARVAVVAIESFSGWGRERRESGTGVLISAEGLVLTNAHVVDRAARVRVTLSSGEDFRAELRGIDRKSDLAVLALRAPEGARFTPIAMGDSDTVEVGELVMAIGNPYGLAQSATVGIVSAKGRADIGLLDYEDFLQTDAEIHPGNSGGPLIDLDGRMLGLNSAVSHRRMGYGTVGFAIPTRLVERVVADLVAHGKVTRAYLGVRGGDLPYSQVRELDGEVGRAIELERVEPGTPAQRAGLRAGDVIVALDGEAITTYRRFRLDIASRRPGSPVELQVRRGETQQVIRVELAELLED